MARRAFFSFKYKQDVSRAMVVRNSWVTQGKEAAGFIISGKDRIGAAAEALKGLAEAGINGVAGAAMVCDGQFQLLVVVNIADSAAAAKALGA